ncbi:uncharacterized protein LOC129728729 [Wyeomyia smithii]|uniref:uncharacterized protein LOC129728729 n=1 Tax=Wyeomyia smithii TaxID=174621 RepID=UPI002467B8F8|nr:uncharacterized protein LOC129728729 [Wyeomyia smithii]
MVTSFGDDEKCLYCAKKEDESEDVNWVQCAHFSCAGVDQKIAKVDWYCPQCAPSGNQLKVPEKMKNVLAKQMEDRKKQLARKKALFQEQLQLEREMREEELQFQREVEKYEQQKLDDKLAAERKYLKKRDEIRKQREQSARYVNALKEQDGVVGGMSDEHVRDKVRQLHERDTLGQTNDFWGAFLMGNSMGVDRIKNVPSQLKTAENAENVSVGSDNGEEAHSVRFTTEACGFSNLENLKRLQDCRMGDALEAVRSRLVIPDSVPDVIMDLRNLFGKPEKLVKTLLAKVRSAPSPKADRLESFIHFGTTVKQLCDHLEAAHLNDHLDNPMLVQELVDKLLPSYKLDWIRFKRNKVDSPLRIFTNFTNEIVSDVSEVTEFDAFPVNEPVRYGKGIPKKKEFVHVYDSEQKRNEGLRSEITGKAFWICKRSGHLIKFCEEFRRMNVTERLKEIGRQKLCELCLNKHGNHHPLLYRVEESVQLQKAECDVTLHVGNRQYDTVAFLDEGSSAILVDEEVAKRLRVEGNLEPLIVTWTGDNNRFENGSRKVELLFSEKGSLEKFPLYNTRTVSKLQLPKQNVRVAEVAKRHQNLAGVPVKDQTGLPTILFGLDNLYLFAPLESRVGKPSDPIAVRSRLGWSIYGPERRKPSIHSYLNLHSVSAVSNQELHDIIRKHYVMDEAAVKSFAVPEKAEEKRAREILEATTKRVGDCFETGLTWRNDERNFPDSYPMAVRRIKALDRKLNKDPAMKRKVCQQIEEYQLKGYAHKITTAEVVETPSSAVWYLPINVVVNPKKPDKVRLVWDAAASVQGVSLNSELLKGPDMLVPLPRVFCVSGNVRWRSEGISRTGAPQVYDMDVATFGATCSPYSAQFIKNLNADEFAGEFPEASMAIITKFYVDDYYDSVDTVEQAIQRAQEVHPLTWWFPYTQLGVEFDEVFGGTRRAQCRRSSPFFSG